MFRYNNKLIFALILILSLKVKFIALQSDDDEEGVTELETNLHDHKRFQEITSPTVYSRWIQPDLENKGFIIYNII